MISLQKVDNAIKFTFTDSQHYLYGDGVITVPVNSLLLVTDDSNMATFKKIDGDVFISALYSDFGMSKSELEAFYKNNMVGSTGGGGVTSGEVQTMIDESISGKADTSALTAYTLTSVTEALDGIVTAHTANTTIHVTAGDKLYWDGKSDFSGSYNDLTDKPTIPTVPTSNTAFTNDAGYVTSGYVDSAVSGKQDTLVSGTNIKTINNESLLGSGNIDIQGGGGVNVVQTTGSSTADVMSQSAVTTAINAVSGAIPSTYVSAISKDTDHGLIRFARFSTPSNYNYFILDNPKINGTPIHIFNGAPTNYHNFSLVEASAITSAVTSASTDSEIPSAKAVYDALGQGGGAASSAITSGDTNAVAGGAVYDKFDEVEQVTAAALNALNDNFGGLKLVRLTQQEYDNLSVKDSQTLYIIADVPFAGKWLATYTGGTTDSASCDSTSAITGNEITLTDLENLVIGDCVESIDMWAFDGATSLTSVTISDSVTSIGNYTFQNCNGLTDVTIGSGVTSIGEGAFASTNGSFTLTIHATTPPTLTNGIFDQPNGGIFVPAEAVQDYQNANIWSNYAQGIQPIQ